MKKATLLMALLCLLILSCCKQESKLPENYQAEVCNELSQIVTKSLDAWVNEDLETYVSFLDKDFLNMFAYGPATNLEENREAFKNIFDNYSIEDVKNERTGCFADHQYSFDISYFEQKWISNDTRDTIPFKMRVMMVYKKQNDGSWKIFRIFGQDASTTN